MTNSPLLDLETLKDNMDGLIAAICAVEDAINCSPNVAETYTPALHVIEDVARSYQEKLGKSLDQLYAERKGGVKA